MISVIIGTQWGDEGKGKLVDILSQQADYAVRFHGGNNAGHTVVIDKKPHFFHLIPSGIFQRRTTGVIGPGVILDLEVLLEEIKIVKKAGVDIAKKLVISPRCHIILPYHRALDQAYENARGKNKLGTTGRGIGPCYADKVSYNGIRIYELMDWTSFVEKFSFQLEIKNKILKLFGVAEINLKSELSKYKALRSAIKPYVQDTFPLFQNAMTADKNILLEGAHGIMLDTDWSPYPFSTGSNTVIGAANAGAGIASQIIDVVYGVVKAYTSRVGGGPIPTELDEVATQYIRKGHRVSPEDKKIADKIREKGHEYGTTTGRPRRVGWLDLEAVKFACDINKVSHVAITKIDILSGLKTIKVCVGYKLGSKNISYSSCGYNELAKVKPVYKTFKGWKEDISKVKQYDQLPQNCKVYLDFISDFLHIPIKIVSVGPDRNETIFS